MPDKLKIFCVYAGGLLVGLTLVSFPASSEILKKLHGFTDAEYGSIFLPQLAFAILGALIAGIAVRRTSLKSIYLITLGCFLFSQIALGASVYVPSEFSLYMVMLGTASFGFGFGFGGGPLNGLVSLLFPRNGSVAITALHTIAGSGLMLGPLYFNLFIKYEIWWLAPFCLAVISLSILSMTTVITLPDDDKSSDEDTIELPYKAACFWTMIIIVVLYAISEGAFSNWAIIYITESKRLSDTAAATSLSAFWAGLTFGRLAISFLVFRIEPIRIVKILTILIACALLLLPGISSSTQAVTAFAFAGVACSGVLPLIFSIANEVYPAQISWIASMLTASLMFGVGIGSYLIGNLKGLLSIEQIYQYAIVLPVVIMGFIAYLDKTVSRSAERQ